MKALTTQYTERYLRLSQLCIKCLFAPLREFIRYWQRDEFGHRLTHVLIEIVVLVHLLIAFGQVVVPHLTR